MRTTVTFPDTLYQKAVVRMKERDFLAFSDYLQHLIREDTKHLPAVVSYPEPAEAPQSLNDDHPKIAKKRRHLPKKQEN